MVSTIGCNHVARTACQLGGRISSINEGGCDAGLDERTGSLFCYVDLEDRVPANHPLHVIRRIVNDVLAALDGAAPL
jgi:hypothetical protein